MKAFLILFLLSFLPGNSTARSLVDSNPYIKNRSGFHIPDSLEEVSFRYKTMQNLVILPVIINDNIQVNLILDTGCRNMVLFGKRFQKLLNVEPGTKVQFSGLGAGPPVRGGVSLNNKVTIGAVLGEEIPIVVVPQQNLFQKYANIHGVIGYEIFLRFEIELNPGLQRIVFRPAMRANLPPGYTHVPIRVEDSRPLIDCEMVFSPEHSRVCRLMIDTGSSLGLLLKTKTPEAYRGENSSVLGRGLNGELEGISITTKTLRLGPLEMQNIRTGIIYSPWNNYASIGMATLSEYCMILNYYKGYAGFRREV